MRHYAVCTWDRNSPQSRRGGLFSPAPPVQRSPFSALPLVVICTYTREKPTALELFVDMWKDAIPETSAVWRPTPVLSVDGGRSIWVTFHACDGDQQPYCGVPLSLCHPWTVKGAQMSWGAHAVMFNVSPWHCGQLHPVLLSYLVHAAIAPGEGCLCKPFWCWVFPGWQPAFIILLASAIYIFEWKDLSLPSSCLPPQSPEVLPGEFGGYSLTWSWGRLLWKSQSVRPLLCALGQASTATHRVSKPPFPCGGVGCTREMSQPSGPKVGSQRTPTCSRRKPRHASREESHIGGCPLCISWLGWSSSACATRWTLLCSAGDTGPGRGLSLQLPCADRLPGNRYTDTAKCLAYHLSWIFKWYRKALCLIPGCLMDLRGGKSMPLIWEHWSVFLLPFSTDQSLQAATLSFTVRMAISSTYIF